MGDATPDRGTSRAGQPQDRAIPAGWDQLHEELRRGRDTFALLHAPGDDGLVDVLAGLVDELISVGKVMADIDDPELLVQSIVPCRDSTLLTDLDALFAPALKLDPLALVRRMSHGRALFVVWPGSLGSARLTYSKRGRADYFEQPARDLVVLRPTGAVFPDEAPYELERFPA